MLTDETDASTSIKHIQNFDEYWRVLSQQSMKYNLEDGRRGELIREGIKVAIIGETHVTISSRIFP